ncbi:hypothetical protein Tco_1168590 [Tanacetum coccineum]
MSSYSIPHSSTSNYNCSARSNILFYHPLSYALTTTADVPAVTPQQFWSIVSKVPDIEDTIKFLLDTEQFTYTMDMFHDTLKLQVETPKNPFKEAIQYPCFIKLILADLMKKFPNIPKRIEEDYHSIKDDVPLVNVYTTRNVLVRGMLILNAFLTAEIQATNNFKEYETVFMKVDFPMNQSQPVVSTQGTNRGTPRALRSPTVSAASPQRKKMKHSVGESSSPQKSLKITIRQKQIVKEEKYDDDSKDRLEPGSHKENPKIVDDDDKVKENVDEKKDDKMGSLEIRTEEM